MGSFPDMTGVVVLSIIGLFVCFLAVPAAVLAIVVVPYCLWTHDFSIVLPAAGVGAVIGAALFGWMFRRGF